MLDLVRKSCFSLRDGGFDKEIGPGWGPGQAQAWVQAGPQLEPGLGLGLSRDGRFDKEISIVLTRWRVW